VGVAGYRLYRDGQLELATAAANATVNGLACGTTYEFGVEAYDAAGNTSERATAPAATAECPGPPPTALSLDHATRTSLTLSWMPPPGDVESYRVYVDGELDQTVTFPSAQIDSLTCGTSYEIGVEAVAPGGKVSSRATLAAATSACPDTTPPGKPPGLAVQAVTATSVTLRWNASTDNVGVAGYYVRSGGQLLETTTARSIALAQDCGTTVTYEVRAFDAAGNESAPASIAATTSDCPDVQPPTMPGGLTVSEITRTGLKLAWQASSDDVGVTGYRVYRDGVLLASQTATALDVSGLKCGTRYAFEVEAVDAAGNASDRAFANPKTSTCPDLDPPSAPGDLRRTAATHTRITVEWDESTDDVGVAGYRTYLDGELVEETTGTSFTFEWMTCGSPHEVGVEAFDTVGRTSVRATLSTATADCDTSPPQAPGGLEVVRAERETIVLRWEPAADDWRTARYHVDHDGVMGGATAETSLAVPGLACGTAYELGVRAFDSANNPSPRSAISATTAACPADPPEEPPAAVFVAPGGDDDAPCTQAEPCRGFDRAYEVAEPGEVVEAAAGDYGEQSILAVAGRAGPDVVFRPAAGARVVFDGLTLGHPDNETLGPSHITLRGMHGSYRLEEPGAGNQASIFVAPGTSHITLDDMDAGALGAHFASHITVRGGDYGPCDATWGAQTCGGIMDVASDVLIDGARIHDFRFDETCLTVRGADCHWECMYVNGGERITIRNSMFYGCTLFDIFATISGPDAGKVGHKDLRIENNWFATPWTEDEEGGAPTRPSAISLAWCTNSDLGYRGVDLRFNSFEHSTGLAIDTNPACVFEDVNVTGNLLAWDGSCQDTWSFAYNVWTTELLEGSCSATDRIVGTELPYAEPRGGAAMDFHLVGPPGDADGLVPAASCPALDIDGEPRPAGAACDAGADERPG
jgi:chitodextrinase